MSMKQSALYLTAALTLFAYVSQAQNKKVVASPEEGFKAVVIQNLQNAYPSYKDIALQIWNYAELGYKEVKSSALLVETLRKEGFTLETG
ncbi:MAG: amidohydrolase, partial [Oxalobacteraceae bacterium]|nr:amidohydrolase [Oxalobacteraceae bacterium]